MKKFIRRSIYIAFLIGVLYCLHFENANSNSVQPPAGRTKDPVNNSSCQMCHGSFAAFTSTRASVSIGTTTTNQVPLSGFHYVAGTQYIIFFSALSHSARTGFEISSLNAANGNAGTLAVTNAANTTFGTLGGIGYIGHHNADTTKNWSFHWTAPAATAGNITFYTAVNITNNNGNDAGDSIFHNTFIISPVPITVSAGNDTTVCAGSSAQLVAVPANTSGAVTYAWSPTSGLTCSNCANPTATPLSTTTYTVTITNSGQTATDAVTVNVLSTSAPIINVTSNTVCPGAKDTLSTPNSFVSYHWSTGSTTTSTVVITGGAYSLDVTDANGCTTSTAIAIGTGQAPTANVTAGGPLNFCAGSSVTLTANSGTGYTYHWSTGASTAAINVTQTGSYIVTVHNVCDSAVSSATSVIVNSIVTPSIAINSSGSIICTGTQVTFSVSGISNGGSSPSYQWKKNGNNVGTNTTSYADNALLNGDIITCVLTSNAVCTSSSTATSNPVIMTVNPILTPALTITTSATTICDGAHVTFNVISTSNGGNGPVYQWKKNGNNVGTNSTSYADNALLNNDVITCVVTSNATCASPVTATSNTITMTVNPILIPSVSIGASATTICAGTLVTFTATPTNGGAAPAYQWKKNGNNVGTSSVTYTDNGLANNDVISCVLTSNATCASPTTATSNTVTMTVNPTLVPAINVGASATTICADTLITFTATPTNGGATPAYQWKKNGNNVGANSATYSDNGLVNNDAITCVLTSNASCASPVTATSNAISITVNPLLVPAISVNASQTTVCAGSVVIFTAPATNGGAAPVYQWKKNNVDVGINSDTYVDSTLANNDVVSCVLTSNALCASPLTATSNNITITLSGTVTPSISITAPGLICQGQPALFTATAVNGGTNPVYQWRKNGNNVGGNSSTYSDNGLGTNDVITCALTSNAGCVAPDTANSNSVTVTVNATVTPSLTIAASDTNICAGTPVTFTATPTDGGITPAYQWLKNGSAVGSNSATYADNTLSSADTIKCILTSNATCATASTATSNFIIVTVNAVVIPAVSIGSTATNICAGTPVTFTATSTNGGATSVYQWKKNGNNVGSNSATYIDSTLNDNDAISCVITSNATCASPTTATSSSITVSVTALVTPSVSISVSPNDTVCAGTLLTFTATANNEGNAPGYQWLVNGLNVTGNGNTYVSGSLLSGDLVSVILAPNAQCVSVINVTSNSIRLTINPIPATPVIVTVGVDSIASSVSGDSYEWLFNDAASGLATQTIGLTQSGSYKVIVTATGCVSDTSAAFNYTFTGLKEINDVIVKLYPNPNQGNFIIDANADIDIIRLYDVTGRIIFEQQQIKASRFIVDIPLVTAGLLNVEIISGGNRWIGKISVVK